MCPQSFGSLHHKGHCFVDPCKLISPQNQCQRWCFLSEIETIRGIKALQSVKIGHNLRSGNLTIAVLVRYNKPIIVIRERGLNFFSKCLNHYHTPKYKYQTTLSLTEIKRLYGKGSRAQKSKTQGPKRVNIVNNKKVVWAHKRQQCIGNTRFSRCRQVTPHRVSTIKDCERSFLLFIDGM